MEGKQTCTDSERNGRQIGYWSRDLKTRDHTFYLKRVLKMEQVQQQRSKLELFMIAVVGGCVMYYGAILLVAVGLWCSSEYYHQRNNFKTWVMQWESGPIEITLEPDGKEGGIVLANNREVDNLDDATNYLFIQGQDLARCKGRLGEILTIVKE